MKSPDGSRRAAQAARRGKRCRTASEDLITAATSRYAFEISMPAKTVPPLIHCSFPVGPSLRDAGFEAHATVRALFHERVRRPSCPTVSIKDQRSFGLPHPSTPPVRQREAKIQGQLRDPACSAFAGMHFIVHSFRPELLQGAECISACSITRTGSDAIRQNPRICRIPWGVTGVREYDCRRQIAASSKVSATKVLGPPML